MEILLLTLSVATLIASINIYRLSKTIDKLDNFITPQYKVDFINSSTNIGEKYCKVTDTTNTDAYIFPVKNDKIRVEESDLTKVVKRQREINKILGLDRIKFDENKDYTVTIVESRANTKPECKIDLENLPERTITLAPVNIPSVDAEIKNNLLDDFQIIKLKREFENVTNNQVPSRYEEREIIAKKGDYILFIMPAPIKGYGWGNGYVGVPISHKLYGKNYNDIDIDIHGHLTFGELEEIDGNIYWVFGFDTVHGFETLDEYNKEFVIEETHRLYQQLLNLNREHENDLVSFGNYLLSEERRKTIINEQNFDKVTDADLANWKKNNNL